MTRISLVVSDVDGTLLTHDKVLTEGAKAAVRRLHAAGIGFTIVSSRPTIGMGFLIEQLSITLPVGAFNGSSIVDAHLKPIEQHLIDPAVAQRSLHVLKAFGVDTWLFTNECWYAHNPDGEYVPLEKRASGEASQSTAEAVLLQRCEAAMKDAVGTEATAVRSQTYYLDVTPPGYDKGTFVDAMIRRLGISAAELATIGDMENDLPMFARSGVSFAMGNAADGIKGHATHVTESNERDGFAHAVETMLQLGCGLSSRRQG